MQGISGKTFEISISPLGHLFGFDENNQHSKLASAFENSVGKGLFLLATTKDNTAFSPSAHFWRDFSCLYMTARCHSPDLAHTIGPIAWDQETQKMLQSAPPMRGAEYLTPQVLEAIWNELDRWFCQQITQSKTSLAGYLKKHAPQWRQVGRVCFHLAENVNDPEYPFAFLATYAPEVSLQGKVQYQPLGKALQTYAGAQNKKKLIHLLSPIQTAAESSDLIKTLVESSDIYHPLIWTPEEAYQFIREADLYEAAGIVVRLPNWWKKRPRPRVSVTIGNTAKHAFNADSMLDFNLSFALGDKRLTAAEWKKLMAAEDGLVLIKGQWVEVNKEKLSQALQHWQEIEQQAKHGGLSFIEGMRLLAGTSTDLAKKRDTDEIQDWSFVQGDRGLTQMLNDLRDPTRIKITQPGKSLKGTLRPYQSTGVNWLWHLSQLGLGACLADDMGLGKTIQIIALLLKIKKMKLGVASLLVLPASLLNNWKDELSKFAPSIKCQFIHSSLLDKKRLSQLQKQGALNSYDVILTSYGMLRNQPWLLKHQWQLVILDEAHAIKNPGTRTTKSVKQLKAHSRIALTGTPIENRLGDLWSLFDFLCPGLLGSATTFKKFAKSLDDSKQAYAPLKNLLQPYILRRLKSDKSIISDLPDKTEVRAYCELSKTQAVLYEKSIQELTAALEEGVDGMKRRGLVLSYILRFKQICNHPSQLKGDGLYAAKESGKFLRLGEICEEISSRQEKVLIFTQFREMIDPIANFLADCFGQPGLTLHGGTSVPQRKKMVDQFQAENGPPFFVLSIKAGGTGLTLTAASHVIHFDRWWNPAVENQATDRAYRIGQKQNVLVHKFVCKGTIESKIDELISDKMDLANNLLEQPAENRVTEMSNSELLNLIKLDINQI